MHLPRRTLWLVLVAGLAGALGIAYSVLWPLALASLSLFLYALWTRPMRWKAAMGYGFLYGVLTGGAGIIWFLDAYPIARLGIRNPALGYFLVWTTWLYVAAALGLAVSLGAPCLRAVRRLPAFPLFAALAWAVIEQGRMWGFALATWAPQSWFGAHFSVASVGYVLAAQPYLLQLAHPFGLPLLDFSAALFAATCAALALRGERRAGLAGAAACALVLLLPIALPYHPAPATSSLRFELVATDFPPEQLDVASAIGTLFGQAAADPAAQVVVFPEGYGLVQAYASTTFAEARTRFGARPALLMFSSYSDEGLTGGPPGVEALRYLDVARGTVTEYRKIFLVPVGEYEPVIFTAYYSLFNNPAFQEYLGGVGGRSRRGDAPLSYAYDGVRLGGLLCSDLIDPWLYHDLAYRHGAQVLVSLSNYSWFHTSPRLYDKMLEIAKVTAVETRRPLVVANNGAPSYALDEDGAFIAKTPWHADTVLPVTIPVRP